MTPEAQKRIDEQVKYLAEQREKKKTKKSSNFSWEKYKPPTSTPTPTPTYNDPLKRNLTEAERLAMAARGEKISGR